MEKENNQQHKNSDVGRKEIDFFRVPRCELERNHKAEAGPPKPDGG